MFCCYNGQDARCPHSQDGCATTAGAQALALQFHLADLKAIVKVEEMIPRLALLSAWLLAVPVFGQEAVSSSNNPQQNATPSVSPSPAQPEGPAPRIPALEELDQAF